MKRKFTLLIAAVMLLTMMASTGTMWGQSDYSTDYTGNITLSTAGGTNASDCVIAISGTNYAGIKAGTSSKVGAVVVTVPSGTKYLHIHAAAWNGTTASLAVTPDGYSENIALTANSGIASNSPFTFNGDPSTSDYYKVITFSDALTANTNLTFTAVGGKRFVIWGVTSEEESSGDTPSITADNVQMGCLAQGTSISYEIDNYVEGTMSAATEATWITNLEASPDPIDPSFGSIEVTTTINESLSARTATVTLTYTYGAKATVTKNVTVTQAGNPNASGGANNPYTVAQAIAAIDAQGTIEEAYATGIVCQVDSYNSTYSSITYWISDDGTTTTKLQVYSGKGINGEDFSSINDVQVGATVVIKGKLKKYNSTYEFDLNNQLVSYVAPVNPIITVTPATVNAPVEGANGILTVTYENITTVVADVWFCNAAGTEAATYDWITADINADNNVEYLVEANDGAARTAYFKVWAYDDDMNEVYSNLVTINQEEYVAPTYATLPFSFNGGRDDIEDEEGLSQNGLGTDYNASSNPTTKLKFDNTGDWLLLQFNEKPGTLTFDIKGNSFSGGTFTVQTSVDGVEYTNLQVYTDLGDTQSAEFTNLGESVRYIKWIYTNKSNGNVGLGNIALAQYVEPQPSITITPAAITEVPCYGGGGLLEVTYANMGDTPNPQIIKCDSDGNPATYDWLTAEFENGTANIRGTISANNSNADRTAYLKVCGTAVNSETVCSNIVSITQLAYPTITTATLPFAFDGDNEELATTAGLAQAGLGSSYGDSPKLKFKETGSFVILHFNEAPNTLTFDIKGDGFDGTFKVQTSADNVTYTDLKVYTSSNLTDNLVSESFNTLNANVRYIKWVYTAATSGKVRLGNIGLTNFSPSITLNTYAISVDANQHDGTLDATYEFIDFTNDPEVVWFESDGVTPAANDPDWVVAIINTDKDFDYTIVENNDAASRTAYFKVYAFAETSGNDVYSDLVTVTQEGKVTLYTIMFDTDGGTFVGNNDFNSEIVQKQTGVYSLPSAIKDNVTFAGWKLDGTDDIYAAGAQYEVTADVSFTAQWSNAMTATITFGSAEGSTKINQASVTGKDSQNNTWTITTEGTSSFNQNAAYSQVGSSNSPATSITFTMTLPNDVTISAFSAKFGGNSGTAGNITLQVGETTVGTGSLNASVDVIVNSTSTAYGNVLTVTVTNIAKGVKAYYISYSYELGTDPIIIAPSSVDLAYNATSGEIEYSIINPATGVSLDATTTESWISNFVITDDKVTFTTTANTETTERQGTITLSYQGADDKDVTIIQAAYVPPVVMENYALFTGDLVEGDYIIYYNGKAMNNVVSSGRLQYAEIEPDNNVIATDNAAIVWHIALNNEDYWTIYSADANAYAASTGAKNKAQMLEDGTDDMAMWTVTEIYGTYEFVNKANAADDVNANLRNNGTNGWACYSTQTGGALTLYKKAINIVTYNTTIAGYGDSENGGYRLIASPVSSNPADVTGMIAATPEYYDLFIFDQTAEAEWYNYKAHNFYLTPGKGYLYANKEGVELSFNGMPYEGDGNINLTYDENAPLKGWNLIGNPYGTSATLSQAYYRLNADGNALNAATESTAVNLMEGVFVKATEAGQIATFTAQSKNEAKAIAQTNIMVSNAKGSVIDNAIVRFDGGSTLEKFSLRDGSTQLYIPQNDNNYAIVSADAKGDIPLNFKAETTGQYTIRIKIDGANVGYMHLFDKLSGEDINLLIEPEYSFIGSPRDAEDRFIIRFTEINANDIFAYQNGSDIIVNGNGELQVFDVTGRMVMNTKINGIQTVNVPATGMYIFRMVGESVQTQKIVVR